MAVILASLFFFFNDTATTEIYTLSLHDALPIRPSSEPEPCATGTSGSSTATSGSRRGPRAPRDRKSTRLNSSHANISYAVFCLKKKKKNTIRKNRREQTTSTIRQTVQSTYSTAD